MAIVFGVIFLLSLFGGMAFAVMYQLKKTDPKNIDNSLKVDVQSAQEFLPFQDIKDSMIDLGGHHYRAIIECSSINYNLKTDKEKEIIELSFQRFCNSLNFPLTFFIQTRTVDNTKMLENLKVDLEQTIKDYPNLTEYANIYYGEIADLPNHIGNNKMKKKYIIVPCCEALELGNLNDEEKYDYSLKEIYTRSQILMDGLSSMGIKSKILDTKSIAELLCSAYHKDNYSHADQVLSGEYLGMFVEGKENKLAKVSPDAKLDWILYEAQVRLQTELQGEKIPEDVQESTTKAIEEINKIRDAVAGYYNGKEKGHVQSLTSLNTKKKD